MTILIFIFLLLTGLFYFLHYKILTKICLLFALVFFWFTGSGLLGQWLLKPLQFKSEYFSTADWGKNNALLVLGTGTFKQRETQTVFPGVISYSRIAAAARLYFDCKKTQRTCKIILSGGDQFSNGVSEAGVMQKYLLDLKINSADILLEEKSHNTFQNAQFSSEILQAQDFDKVFLISSNLHMQRSILYLQHFGIHPIPITSDYLTPYYSTAPRGYNFAVTDYIVHEYVGIARYHFYNFMEWN